MQDRLLDYRQELGLSKLLEQVLVQEQEQAYSE
jgi:hypothetical protein